ncbi:hypothetical protein GCM10010371_24570 [Streptomyces subrutilus]|uniref:Uncharacterized protein n=1 Tax=Streptomyces subrutilus TaxID=36818 RepID=A0A918QQQ4_9ACTN|nr:hypothetical protein GCM10010371_24570 [Streptomyces subrutilus]
MKWQDATAPPAAPGPAPPGRGRVQTVRTTLDLSRIAPQATGRTPAGPVRGPFMPLRGTFIPLGEPVALPGPARTPLPNVGPGAAGSRPPSPPARRLRLGS